MKLKKQFSEIWPSTNWFGGQASDTIPIKSTLFKSYSSKVLTLLGSSVSALAFFPIASIMFSRELRSFLSSTRNFPRGEIQDKNPRRCIQHARLNGSKAKGGEVAIQRRLKPL